MCGIAGVINPQNQPIAVAALQNALAHRGPDAQTAFTQGPVTLIHTRLSIQDLAHGKQPFHYGPYSIVFNGEIYNHLALRRHLPGVDFQTQSDTETLLHLYIQFGPKMFTDLDGMFAFCIYDQTKDCLFLARDRAGKKPLYYHHSSTLFAFASELNALKRIKHFAISSTAIQSYLSVGYIWGSHTAYEQITELAAGSMMEVSLTTLQIKQTPYFDILSFYLQPKSALSFEAATAQLESLLHKSVLDRVQASDVEVGAFLSGGIDSGLVVAMAATALPQLKTFTIQFEGNDNEAPLAELVAQQYGTQHTTLSIELNVKQDVEKILLSYGEPFMDSSAIPSYYVSKAAREHVKIALNGDGADELFGGYRRYVLASSPLYPYLRHCGWLLHFFPRPNTKKSAYTYLYRALYTSSKKELEYYLSMTADIWGEVREVDQGALTASLRQLVVEFDHQSQLSPLAKLMCLDFKLILGADLLVKMDIASMANSLEARSPFLSKYLLEYAPTLPDAYKINGTTTKAILRHLAKKYLPAALVNQPKRGFEVPLQRWVDHDLKEPIFDRLQPGCYAEQYLPRTLIQSLLQGTAPMGSEQRAKALWCLYCLELWYQNEA